MRPRHLVFPLLVFLIPCIAPADVSVIDFEGFADSTLLTNQIPGLTFSNAIILTAGVSLDEFEFPPHSGANVVSDNGGPITIDFTNPVLSFAGYFTYLEPLSVAAFDSTNSQVDLANSLFSNNLALSGDSGSSPNEFIQVSSAGGIDSVVITGDPGGGSFTLDDATLTTSAAVLPEPGSYTIMIGTGILAMCGFRFLRGGGTAGRSQARR
jgi:hypothetical protein